MFSLPKRLSTSFGIIGDDPKLAFRTQPSGIRRLAEARNIPATDDKYWSQFVELFDSASDVYSLISSNDIRRALNEAPENLKTLIDVISARLFRTMGDHTFPSPPQSAFPPVANIAATWASVSGSSARDSTKELLNCLRVLGRVIPILYESEGPLEEEILWKRKKKQASPHEPTSDDQEAQFVIEEDDSDEDGEDDPPEAATPTRPSVAVSEEELEPALADRLLSTAIDLMFCCGFTIPSKFKVDNHKVNYTIWEKGIGSTVEVQSSSQLDANKIEVLRFFEVLLSKTIYMSPSHVLLLTNPCISRLVHNHRTPRRLVLPILCSLLNTAMNSGSYKAPTALMPTVGGVINGVGGMVKELPYNHLVWKEDNRPHLVSASLGVLVALLDYQSAEGRDVPVTGGNVAPAVAPNAAGGFIEVPVAPTAVTNSFRYFLAKLHRPADLDYILNGILGILEQHMNATHNVLPGSRKGVPYVLETFLFFWKMVELNKKFRTHLTESDKVVEILVYLLLFCLEHKDKPQHHGLCRALSYIIQTLSSEPAFGTKMTLPVPSRIVIPAKWAVPGCTADFFISAVYYTVATTSGQLNFTYPALLIALANAAPNMQHLQVPSATRLIQLFTSFSNPNFLLADDGHPRLVFLLLEIFNQIIYHQFQENPNLIYAILRSHKRFEDLGTFTLAKGLREIKRIKEAKEEAERIKTGRPREKGKALDVGSPTSTPASNDSPSSRFTNLEDSSVDKLSLSRASSEAALSQPRDDDTERPIPVPPTPSVGSAERQFANMQVSSPPASMPGMSEKARGKMKEPATGQEDEGEMTPELLSVAAAGVGRNGFVPTQEWVTSWQQGLPLDTVLLLISELLPKIQELQNSSKASSNIGHIIDFLRVADIRGSLPTPPPITPRRFQWSDASLIWLSSMIWGEIFVKGTASLAIWNGTNVRLFGVRHTPQPRGVSNFVGGLLGSPSPTATSPTNTGSGGHSRRVSRAM
ncbi:hypothetical protein FRC04_001939 [Tulasnella sp. 424]|nr:hypothetical protein FRC04_001939 [Tulasnella sp. 424]KAG8977716.1 hypothetical protein FRC05_000972 [Tulasnella sp. 425]